ncbi:MAG: TonB-dependent receptor [Pseudomonadota bacterium]
MKTYSLYAACVAALFPMVSVAQSATQDDTPVDEIIVTAIPLGKDADSLSQPVTVLNEETLSLLATSSIGETLATQPGISSTYFGPIAGRPVIRGQAGPRVTVLDSGISTLDVADLSPDHVVPVESLFVERVEILRGPSTLLYGSSAAGGVVNVIDGKIPTSAEGESFSAVGDVRADTAAGERAYAARLDGGNANIRWHLNAFDRSTDDIEIDGFATADEAERPEEEPNGEVINSFGESSGSAAGATFFGSAGSIGFAVSQYDTTYGLPGPEEEEEGEEEEEAGDGPLAAGPFIDLEQTRFDVRGEYLANGWIERVNVKIGVNDYEHSEIEPNGEVATVFENDAVEARIEAVHQRTGNWRGAFGVQYLDRDFSAVGEEAFIVPTKTENLGFFVLEELEQSFGTVELGARVERLTHDPLSTEFESFSNTTISLAAGVNFEVNPTHDLSINLSRSERNPDAAELYSEGAHLATGLFEIGVIASGASFDDEVSTNLDVAWHHHGGLVDWTLSAFINNVSNYTFRALDGSVDDGLPVAIYVQSDSEFYGFEAEVNWQPGGVDSPWNVRAFSDFVYAESDDDYLPRIQPPRVGLELDYDANQWRWGASAIHHAEQDNISSFNTDAFTMLGGHVRFRPEVQGPFSWEVFVKASNLLDEPGRRSTSFRAAFVPLPGTSLHFGFRAGFN